MSETAPAIEQAPVVEAAPAASVVVDNAAPPSADVIPAATEAAPAKVEAEKPAEPAKAFDHTETPSLLDEIDPKVEEAKADEPKPDAKPIETPEIQPELATYEFTAPEGITLPQERIEPYIATLKEHGIAPAVGQKLLDMYVQERQQDALNTLEGQHRVFAEMRAENRARIQSDPELGGSGFETVKKAVARGRDLLVGENDRQEFNDFVKATGAGDHPAFWRLLYRAANRFDEPTPPPSEERHPAPNPQGNRGRNGRSVLFDA